MQEVLRQAANKFHLGFYMMLRSTQAEELKSESCLQEQVSKVNTHSRAVNRTNVGTRNTAYCMHLLNRKDFVKDKSGENPNNA